MTKSIDSERADFVEDLKCVLRFSVSSSEFFFPCSVDLVQNWQPYPVDMPNLLNESDETIQTHPLPPVELYLHHCTYHSIDRW